MQKDRILFNSLFKQHYSSCVYVAYAILRDQQSAEDAVQELFIDLWNKRDKLFQVKTHQAYLKKATQFKCFDIVRKRKRTPEFSDEMEFAAHRSILSPEDEIVSKENLIRIKKAIDALPEKGRAIFYMSRRENMTYQEIADTLKISKKTVEYHMSQNLTSLKEAIFSLILLILLYL